MMFNSNPYFDFFAGHVGGALYNVESACLRVLDDVHDLSPEFKLTSALLRQCNPNHLIVPQRLEKHLKKVILELCGIKDDEAPSLDDDQDSTEGGENESNEVTGIAPLPSSTSGERSRETRDSALRNTELIYLTGKEFGFPSCKRRILNLHLPQESPDTSEDDHFLYINGLFNFGCENAVRAVGALLKFLDHNKIAGKVYRNGLY